MNGTSLTVAAKKKRTGSVDRRQGLQYAVPKPGDGKEEGPSMLNECNCGPAHLRRARPSIRMRDLLSSRKSSCDQTGMRESSRKLGTKDHGIRRNSTHRNAMLCYALAWHSVDMPSPCWNKICDRYENRRPSRRKRWEGCGNGRCAHRRINHTRAGSRPGRRGRRRA